MPVPQELVLIRHGQSTANATGVWQGQLDFPLSEEGRRQARLTGRALACESLDGIYSSPLSRAFDTAEIISREAGFAGGVIALDGLMERRGGLLEGTTMAEREARYPELMKKFLSIPEEESWVVVGAETDEEVLIRFELSISEVRASHPAGARIVVVSHGGAMRAFLRDRFGQEILPGNDRAPNASITRVVWGTDGRPRLRELASTGHLVPKAGETT